MPVLPITGQYVHVPILDDMDRTAWKAWVNRKIEEPKSQRKLVLVIVAIALLLDNMLYMVIVPIIPEYIRQIGDYEQVMNISVPATTTTPLYTTARRKGPRTTTTTVSPTFDIPANCTRLDSVSPEEQEQLLVMIEGRFLKTLRNSTFVCDYQEAIMEAHMPVDDGNSSFLQQFDWTIVINRGAENQAIGFLFASKAIVQILIGPFAGTVIDKVGYDRPMMFGLAVIFFSTVMFAFGNSYPTMFIARSLQGVGSAFADTSGLAMIADRFTEEAERSKALGIALAFISFGCLVAPPFGGILYQFFGKAMPFLALALVALLDGILMLIVTEPIRRERAQKLQTKDLPKGTPIYLLFLDPYIACAAGALAMSNVSLAFLEPTIALWMKDTMNAQEWQMGLIWLPGFFPHILGVFITVILARRYPNYQWMMAAGGLALEGAMCLFIPYCTAFWALCIPIMGICFGIALVDTALLPMLAFLVDVRHTSIYGSVYAIADISYSLAYSFGPVVAGSLVAAVGFTWLNVVTFLTNAGYAPLLLIERNIYDMKKPESTEDSAQDAAAKAATQALIDGSAQPGAEAETRLLRPGGDAGSTYYASTAPGSEWGQDQPGISAVNYNAQMSYDTQQQVHQRPGGYGGFNQSGGY